MTPIGPEDIARENIDAQLGKSGWTVQDFSTVNLHAASGIAVRQFPLKPGHGFADYLLYVDARAIGVIEAKKEGTTLTGVEIQAEKYRQGFPDALPAWRKPLPFCYQSTGEETRFTNYLEPDARSRQVFAFHRPEALAGMIPQAETTPPGQWQVYEGPAPPYCANPTDTLRGRVRSMPPLPTERLWPAQITAVQNLEASLAASRPRALIQMATGSGKTFTAVTFIYRLIKHAGARRVLFLVDRANLGTQALTEFQKYVTPDDGRKFTELYNVQHLQSNQVDSVSRVCITTIQRLYSILKGEPELDPATEEESLFEHQPLYREPVPVEYNPAVPIETFDVIVTDECHRSIYNLWRQVLEYFDAFIIGLTATPSKQTIGFFKKNLVMEYSHEQAVADGVNVNYDVYRIRTKITEQGSTVEAGHYIDRRDRLTRRVRWEQLEDDLTYSGNQLDGDVVAVDQIRTVIRAFRDKLFTEIFPDRTEVPKTLVYAKDDSHADDIVQIIREEFGKGNDFAQKITYKTTGAKPEDLIRQFRNSFNPRIAVTVDMVATGTDIKPLEVILFMRAVKSRIFFDQMKGRGVRVIDPNDLKAVTPDAGRKTHFVIVDAAGVCEQDKTESRPLERKRTVPFEKLVQAVALGNTGEDVISSLAGRIARLDRVIDHKDRAELATLANGNTLADIVHNMLQALDPDRHEERAKVDTGAQAPTPQQVRAAAETLISEAARPFSAPAFRNRLIEIKKSMEQTIDVISTDEIIEAAFSEAARDRARDTVTQFETFIRDNRDEITALQILYSRPYRQRLTFREIKALAEAVQRPPRQWTPEVLWRAYETLDRSRVRGAAGPRLLTDIVSLVRFALHQDDELTPFNETVNARFQNWLAQQENQGRRFTSEQRQWLESIRDHIATSFGMEIDDFDLTPFAERGGLGKAHQIFGNTLQPLLNELNEVLTA